MDYKTNILTVKVEMADSESGEFPGLMFGMVDTDTPVFDYTAYFELNKIDPVDYKVFMRVCKHFIESSIHGTDKKSSRLFFVNTDGHVLAAIELMFLFLSFVNPQHFQYFNHILRDVFADGWAMSNELIFNAALERLPTDALRSLLNARTNNDSN